MSSFVEKTEIHGEVKLYTVITLAGAGLGVGALAPFRRIPSLSHRLPLIEKRLAVLCLLAYLIFALISIYRMISTDFTLGLF